jgi:hypothetical protein
VPDKPTRPLAKASVLAACIAFAMPGATPAFGQVPERSATVGQPFSYTGLVYSHLSAGYPQLLVDPDHDKCGGLSAGVHWGDFGALTPVAYPAESSLVSVPGGWNVLVSASYTYQAPKRPSTGGASVDIEITCDGQLQKESYLPWVTVTVTGAAGGGPSPPGSPPPDSCPLPGIASSVAEPSQLQPCGPPEKKRFGPWEKKALAIAKAHGTGQGLICGIIGGYLGLVPHGLSKLVGGAFLGCALGSGIAVGYIDYLLDTDPPDPHFKTIAKPPHRHFEHVHPGRGITRRGAHTINEMLDSSARATSLRQVFRVTIERASGATATSDPANDRFERKQMLKAADYAQQLARVLDQLRRQNKAAVHVLQRAGKSVRVTPQQVARLQHQIARRGLPREYVRQLTRMGARRSDLLALKRSLVSAPARTGAGRFPDVLAGRTGTGALRAEAHAMRLFTKRVRAHPMVEPN